MNFVKYDLKIESTNYKRGYFHCVHIYKNVWKDNILVGYKYLKGFDYFNDSLSRDFEKTKAFYEKYADNIIVAEGVRTNCMDNSKKLVDTVWLVDFDKDIVKCVNGVTGAESYFIKDALNFNYKGEYFSACSGTKHRWDKLSINVKQFVQQLKDIVNEREKGKNEG